MSWPRRLSGKSYIPDEEALSGDSFIPDEEALW
jgi:hypothetical protein